MKLRPSLECIQSYLAGCDYNLCRLLRYWLKLHRKACCLDSSDCVLLVHDIPSEWQVSSYDTNNTRMIPSLYTITQ